ncbi:hypothetical protein M8C21_028946 [Ambrosia artemisiifolia]|uniref:RING-type E3 ubiquitin transferase n=1 Tax=Ambrosia artemisiifolia TaxID=4212 RepID=A0AAD5GPK6_AMBAR|nr:hypothetical protein M8C21_028946 [Ambrosia artemisiifolia]
MDTAPPPSSARDPIMHPAVVAVDDHDHDLTSEEDVCSICLDSFDSHHNPPTVTNCKHEFHLQCILEWVRHVYEEPEVDHDVEYAGSEFEEQVIRNFEAAARNMHYSRRRNNHRRLGVGSSQIHSSIPRVDASTRQEVYTSLEDFHSLGYASLQDNLASSSSVSTSIDRTSPSVGSPINNVTSQSLDNSVLDSQSPNGSPGRPIAADIHAFSESVKSKFSAASARYKESISKSTQGLKAKLLAKDSPVKELSRGVQREMSAGVARIFGRLDSTLKRNNDGANLNFFKGKRTQDNSAETPRDLSLNVEAMHL